TPSHPATYTLSLHDALPILLPVDRAQNPLALRHLQDADARVVVHRLKRELLVAGDDDGAGDRRQIARLAALLVVLDQLVDLAPRSEEHTSELQSRFDLVCRL